jgi:hypothetical protein
MSHACDKAVTDQHKSWIVLLITNTCGGGGGLARYNSSMELYSEKTDYVVTELRADVSHDYSSTYLSTYNKKK